MRGLLHQHSAAPPVRSPQAAPATPKRPGARQQRRNPPDATHNPKPLPPPRAAMTGLDPEVRVTYPVKDLFERIDQKLDRVDERLTAIERWRWGVSGAVSLAVVFAGVALQHTL